MGSDIFRKQLFLLVLFVLSLTLMVSFSGNSSSASPEDLCRKFVLTNIDKIISDLKEAQEISQIDVKKKKKQLIKLYNKSRKHYKEIEFFIEYYSPFDAKYYINGP